MIVWNEALTLERTVASVREHVEEVVIGVDAASDDGSEKIARRLADRMLSTNLNEELAKKASVDDDPDWGFSKARNAVFDACKGDNWRLILDGHETIQNPEEMAAAIEEAKANGCDAVEIWMHFEPRADGIPQMMFKTTRLMAPSVRYKNPQHNVAAAKKLHKAHNVIVEHRKSDQAPKDKLARDAQRSDATIEGFRQKVRVDSDDARSWFYLATAYKENARYEEGVKAYQECLKYSKWNEERWHARINMGTCYSHLGDSMNAREQFSLALEEFPALAEAYYYLGDLAYKQKKYREAEVWLRRCVELLF